MRVRFPPQNENKGLHCIGRQVNPLLFLLLAHSLPLFSHYWKSYALFPSWGSTSFCCPKKKAPGFLPGLLSKGAGVCCLVAVVIVVACRRVPIAWSFFMPSLPRLRGVEFFVHLIGRAYPSSPRVSSQGRHGLNIILGRDRPSWGNCDGQAARPV